MREANFAKLEVHASFQEVNGVLVMESRVAEAKAISVEEQKPYAKFDNTFCGSPIWERNELQPPGGDSGEAALAEPPVRSNCGSGGTALLSRPCDQGAKAAGETKGRGARAVSPAHREFP